MNTQALYQSALALRAQAQSHLAQIDSILAQMAPPAGEWMSIKQAAERLGLTPYKVRKYAKSNVLQSKITEGGGKIEVWVEK